MKITAVVYVFSHCQHIICINSDPIILVHLHSNATYFLRTFDRKLYRIKPMFTLITKLDRDLIAEFDDREGIDLSYLA